MIGGNATQRVPFPIAVNAAHEPARRGANLRSPALSRRAATFACALAATVCVGCGVGAVQGSSYTEFERDPQYGSLVRVETNDLVLEAELLHADADALVLASNRERVGIAVPTETVRRVSIPGPYQAGRGSIPFFFGPISFAHGWLVVVSGPVWLAVGIGAIVENNTYYWVRIDTQAVHNYARFPILPAGWETVDPTSLGQ